MKSKKLISLVVSVAMMMTMIVSFTSVAYADEAAYTTHAWYTFEEGVLPEGITSNNSADKGSSDVDVTINGKYGKGVKISKREGREADKLYPNLKVTMNDAIAIANGTTVEVEFDYYVNIPGDYMYIYFSDSFNDDYNASGNGYVRVKPGGEAKLYHLATSSDPTPITMSSNSAANVNSWHRIKLILEGSVVEDTKGWILKGAYFDGTAKSSEKWGNTFSTVDFKVLGFRNKMDTGLTGDFGVDNVSITSYPTASTSPVPDRHKFMNKVLTYTDKVDTPAYNTAMDLFEKSYLTKEEVAEALYGMASNSNAFEITDIAKGNSKVHFTTTDTTGGKPVLIVGAYNRDTDALLALDIVKINSYKNNGEDNGITYDLGELPEDDVEIRAFIFSSVNSLMPLASARVE